MRWNTVGREPGRIVCQSLYRNGMGIRTIAVYSEADEGLPFVREAEESVLLGPAAPAESYLNVEAVLAAAQQTGAAAFTPGYGFLSENADFAQAVTDAGLLWVGPSPDAMRAMGDKIAARNRMAAASAGRAGDAGSSPRC